jgi:hypothetical protein
MTSSSARRSALFATLLLTLSASITLAQAPRIFITAGRLPVSFGTLKVGKDSTRGFFIFNTDSNRGPVHIQIIGPFTSNFSLLTPTTFEVGPGKLDSVRINFHPSSEGVFSDSIFVSHDGDTARTKNPTVVHFIGIGLSASDTSPRIALSTSVLQMTSLVDTFKLGKFIIRNVSDTVRYLTGTVSGFRAPFSLQSGDTAFSLVTGDSASYTVRFAPTMSGSYTDTLHVVSNADTLHRNLTVVLRGTAQDVHPSISLSIRYIDFGVVTVGKDSIYELTLYNSGNTGILYDTLTGPTTGPFQVLQGLGDTVLQAKQTMKILIRFNSAVAGSFQDSIVFRTNALATDRRIVVPLVAIAQAAASVSAPSTLMDLRMVVKGHSIEVLNPSSVTGAEVSVFDEAGSCRSTQAVTTAAVTEIDLTALPHGSYFVELTVGNRSQIKRIVH